MSVGCYEEEFRVIEELEEAYAPVEKFQRMKAVFIAGWDLSGGD